MTASAFAKVASDVKAAMARRAGTDRDAEWHRVNSYIADVLKDSHVLYAKLARLQNDFAGHELEDLEKISENVLGLGKSLSQFSKDFYDGKYAMTPSETQYGGGQQQQQQQPPPPPPPEDFDVQADVQGGDTDYSQGQGQQNQGQGQGQQDQGQKSQK